ncbi:MAG: hypothetical protein BMS9Abin26_1434 [Gammaproteobacteria bacterium]|nr:MAG: hypothetical protein BMS9Abin26_1434 [Gammaproteobacteria bacterium]
MLNIALSLVLFSMLMIPAQKSVAEAETDDDRLVQRITQKVIKEMKRTGALQKEIDAGIDRYVQKQQQARARGGNNKAKNVRPVSVKRDHIRGNPDAEISLIEYSDFECPFCKRFHITMKKILKDYNGKVNWIYRHFPLSFHNPGAEKEAEATECATEFGGNDAFWKYSDLIFQRTRSNGKGFPVDNLVPLAVEIGLKKKPFQTCLDSGRYAARVKEDADNAIRSGVTGTPGNFLVDNKTGVISAIHGAVPVEKLKAVIEVMLRK